MMPRSRKESSFDKPSTSPKGKFCVTKLRSCCSTFCMGEILSGTAHEPVDQELRREHPDQRHVVQQARRAALTDLLRHLLDRARVEDAVLPDPFRRQQLVDVLGARVAEE